jgi:hypothetical protein
MRHLSRNGLIFLEPVQTGPACKIPMNGEQGRPRRCAKAPTIALELINRKELISTRHAND